MSTNSFINTSGKKLKMFRELHNWTQQQLAQKLNVSEKTISAWETEERDINLQNAKLICEQFGIPNSYFVFDEGFEKLSQSLREKIIAYENRMEFYNNVQIILQNCKTQIEDDGFTFKKEYLPCFDYKDAEFISFGIFEAKCLLNWTKQCKIAIKDATRHINNSLFQYKMPPIPSKIEYDKIALSKNNLFSHKINFELKDLICCDDINTIMNCLSKMKQTDYTKPDPRDPYAYRPKSNEEYVQSQLNYLLENLDGSLKNYFECIVFLIDNGAFYEKEIIQGQGDYCYPKSTKDVSRTYFFYRLAKEHIKIK